jgi:hypothetical protein
MKDIEMKESFDSTLGQISKNSKGIKPTKPTKIIIESIGRNDPMKR